MGTAPTVARFKASWPDAIVGGTWEGKKNDEPHLTVEKHLGVPAYEFYDYADYPAFTASIGYSQRGCRFKCAHCFVPWKEGRPKAVNRIAAIWRGVGHPKHIHLIDNDFFGSPEWPDRIAEIRDGDFRVCFNQGVNIRVITRETAEALASVQYRDDQFQERRLYTAWDNVGHERVFFRGVDILEQAGVPAKHLMVYMLVGHAENETWAAIWHRFNRMVDRGIQPYPMVFDRRDTDPERYHELKQFQRWVITGLYRSKPFSEYRGGYKRARVERLAMAAAAPSLFADGAA